MRPASPSGPASNPANAIPDTVEALTGGGGETVDLELYDGDEAGEA